MDDIPARRELALDRYRRIHALIADIFSPYSVSQHIAPPAVGNWNVANLPKIQKFFDDLTAAYTKLESGHSVRVAEYVKDGEVFEEVLRELDACRTVEDVETVLHRLDVERGGRGLGMEVDEGGWPVVRVVEVDEAFPISMNIVQL